MKKSDLILFCSAVFVLNGFLTPSFSAEEHPEKGVLIFSDDFERESGDGEWVIKEKFSGAFSIEKGGWIGTELIHAGHGSTARKQIDAVDFILEFDFRFMGGKQMKLVLDDLTCKEVHAGHIARVVFGKNSFFVQDDKTGTMNREIKRDLKANPEKITKYKRLFETKKETAEFNFREGQWVHVTITKSGDLLKCRVGDVEVSIRSEGIAHPKLTQFGPTIGGGEFQFDNFNLWKLR